jgi:hypothetical protein
MTNQQKQVIDIAARLGVSQREIESAITLARTGRVDLIVAVSAQRLSLRAALKAARYTNLLPRVPSRAR